MSLMYNLFKVNYREVCPRRRGFHIKNEESRIHLNQIGISFLNGYHASLKHKSNFEEITAISKEEDFFYQGFFFEGVGMGLTLVDYFSLIDKNKFKNFLAINLIHKYMLNVGAGWAFARLPLVSIERKLKEYDPLLCVFLLNGYGFHQAYFNKSKYVDQRFIPKLSDEALHPFFQGVGRALWFVCGLEAELIYKTIEMFPEKYKCDLWEGVGLASTYAGKVSKEELIFMKGLSKTNVTSLQQGSSFAAGARSLANLVDDYTELASEFLTNCNVSKLSDINDSALSETDQNADPFLRNIQWKNAIIRQIQQKQINVGLHNNIRQH